MATGFSGAKGVSRANACAGGANSRAEQQSFRNTRIDNGLMAKNIIVCCDGTGNQFGRENSNVVKLFQILDRTDLNRQIAFYDPGVGTLPAPEALSLMTKKLTWWFGLAFGHGIKRNVSEAYEYLMRYYEPGDKVYLFGFSRGSYTARVLAGMLYKCGLLERGAENHISYAYDLFRKAKNDTLARQFKKTFARPCPIHFAGLWDTVSTVGWVYNPTSFPFTARNPDIRCFRHAISVDERRTHFRTNLLFPESDQDCKQVWFAGVHADVGGSYVEEESALSKIPLQWMASEAAKAGLLIDKQQFGMIVLGNGGYYQPPSASGIQHDQLRMFGWRIVEHLPRRYVKTVRIPATPDRPGEYQRQVEWAWAPFSGFYRSRPIQEDAVVHQSVLDRMDDPALGYKPGNMPLKYQVEPYSGPV